MKLIYGVVIAGILDFKPVHSSLVFHNHSAISSSFAACDGRASLQSLKYFPVTFSKSGSNAQYKDVCAPDWGVLKVKYTIG